MWAISGNLLIMEQSVNNPAGQQNQSAAPATFSDQIREVSLKAAGFLYLVGDAALFASGMMSGRKKEATTGLIYSVGGLAPALYGSESAEHKLRGLYRKLGRHLEKNGVVLPKDSPITMELLTAKGGALENVQTFLYQYPSEILNAVYAVGGTQLLRSGLQHNKHWDAASGALVAAGGLAGLIIPEEAPEQNQSPTKFMDNPWAWMKEKPLRVSGYLYQLNNVTLGVSVWNEYKKHPEQSSWVAKLATVCSYVLANGLLAISSKDNSFHKTQHDNEAMNTLELICAHIINAQPKEVQEKLLDQVTGFLCAQEEVKMTTDDLKKAILEKISGLTSTDKKPTALVSAPAADTQKLQSNIAPQLA